MGCFTFPKRERLLNRGDFIKINRLGKPYHTAHFKILFMENGLGNRRLGITVTKKIGNSVKRNGIKRRVREYFRRHQTHFPQGYDIVVAAKKGASGLNFWKVKEELDGFVLDETFPQKN